VVVAPKPGDAPTIPLDTAIARYPEAILGGDSVRRWGPTLPFLFKVLSIGAPLSIQAHPNAALARILHARDPINYPDSNHKPEIGVALGPVELLAGLRSSAELADVFTAQPELRTLLASAPTAREASPERVFRALYESPDAAYVAAMSALAHRLESVEPAQRSKPERYFLESFAEYGAADRGLGCFFALNFVTLEPGDAVSIGSDYPHAYLSGDIVECMANSDNVIRAGLTRKFQDRTTLLDTLDYGTTKPTILYADDHCVAPGRFRYAPAQEFFIERCTGEGVHFDFPAVRSAQIVACLDGTASLETDRGREVVSFGDVALVPAIAGGWVLTVQQGTCFVAGTPSAGAALPSKADRSV